MTVDLSVVVVSYNTEQCLRDCLESVYRLVKGISFELFVVDNASRDGSVAMVRSEFPQVKLLPLERNLGFSGANNVAIKQARGRYVLLLNPDTILLSDALSETVGFLDAHPEVGASGVRLELASGKLDKACKRSLPTPWNSLMKLTGLDRVFRNTSLGAYNLTYLDERGVYPVECLVGAYMMVRKEAIDQVGMLDDTFFMYGEDVDWCYRIGKAGWQIYYLGNITVKHLKGESSRKQSYRMIYEFHRAMAIYFNKHYRDTFFLLRGLVFTGIYARCGLSMAVNAVRKEKRVA